MAEGDPAALFRLQFDESLDAEICRENFQKLPYEPTSEQSIYRIPSWLRDLDPNAYEPRVVSIGPYHYGKPQLQAMEKHKYRALNRFLGRNDGISLEGNLDFLEKVGNCYTEPLEPNKWSENEVFSRLMVLDGCFLLELLLDDCPEKHALLSYVKMDMLVLDNQIPLLVLRKLASIANLISNCPSASQPTGSENVTIQIENENITKLIWKFYGNMNGGIPANDAHHVLDAYREGCIGTGAYDGWTSRHSARELYYHLVIFRASSGEGVADGFVAMGGFKDVAFDVSDNIFIRLNDRIFNSELLRPAEPSDKSRSSMFRTPKENFWRFIQILRFILNICFLLLFGWYWRILFGIAKGMFSLPRLTIDGTTRPTLLNLMAFERFHLRYDETHPVTDYVSLMGSLIRSENDVEHLRKESILSRSPGWTDESVVKLFADLSRSIAFDGTRNTNTEIDAFCKRPSTLYKWIRFWRRFFCKEPSDEKALVFGHLTLILAFITIYFTIGNFLTKTNH